jgi:hypothetical protein
VKLTAAGLPVRVPGRNLVPGAANIPANGASANVSANPPDPQQARSLSSFQQGVHRARTAEANGGRHSDPETSDYDNAEPRN